MLSAAVIGTGSAGHILARDLVHKPGVKLIAAADIDQAALARFASAFNVRAYRDARELYARERPALAIIASSNDAHADNVLAAVDEGVPSIYCEKPIATTIEDARRMVDAVERRQVRTSIGFAGNHCGYARALELVKAGQIGRVLSIHLHSYRGYGFWGRERINARGVRSHHAAVAYPEISGGWTIHHACHQVFQLMQIGGSVRRVYGTLNASGRNVPSEELVHAVLHFRNGATGILMDSIGSFRGLRCGIIGTHGTLLLQDDQLRKSGSGSELRLRREGDDTDHHEYIEHSPSIPTRLDDLLQAIRDGGPSPISLRQGLENLIVCHAIRQSSQRQLPVLVGPAGEDTDEPFEAEFLDELPHARQMRMPRGSGQENGRTGEYQPVGKPS